MTRLDYNFTAICLDLYSPLRTTYIIGFREPIFTQPGALMLGRIGICIGRHLPIKRGDVYLFFFSLLLFLASQSAAFYSLAFLIFIEDILKSARSLLRRHRLPHPRRLVFVRGLYHIQVSTCNVPACIVDYTIP